MKRSIHYFGSLFDRIGHGLGCAAALLLSVRLSLGYCALIPLLILWICKRVSSPQSFPSIPGRIVQPLALFLLVVALTSVFGLDLARSYRHIGSLIFFPLTVIAYYDLSRTHGIVAIGTFLIAGQTLSASNTILETMFPSVFPRVVFGKIAQSGQMALTSLAAVGLAVTLGSNKVLLREVLFGTFNFALLTLLCFWRYLPGIGLWFIPLVILLVGSAIFSSIVLPRLMNDYRERADHIRLAIMTIALPCITAALLVNLKRGPWTGVFVGMVIFFSFYAKRLVIPVLVLAFSLFFFVEPIRTRIMQSHEHFFIAGGRNAIWEIGGELALKYPLGIGYENSGILRSFSTEIPGHLKHFHNNLLNILVEAGWIGVALFVWWVVSTVSSALSIPKTNQARPLGIAIGCGFVSWQIAGLVEYNFGDSSVVMVMYVLLGLLVGVLSADSVYCKGDRRHV